MTDESLTIRLAGEPLAKGRVRFAKATGHAYTPERTVNYESRLAHAAQEAMGDRPLMEGPLKVYLEIRMKVAVSKPKKWRLAALMGRIWPTKKPDLDNFAKMLDSLNLVVWNDDSQIVDLHVVKKYHEAPAFLAVVTEINPEGVFG